MEPVRHRRQGLSNNLIELEVLNAKLELACLKDFTSLLNVFLGQSSETHVFGFVAIDTPSVMDTNDFAIAIIRIAAISGFGYHTSGVSTMVGDTLTHELAFAMRGNVLI